MEYQFTGSNLLLHDRQNLQHPTNYPTLDQSVLTENKPSLENQKTSSNPVTNQGSQIPPQSTDPEAFKMTMLSGIPVGEPPDQYSPQIPPDVCLNGQTQNASPNTKPQHPASQSSLDSLESPDAQTQPAPPPTLSSLTTPKSRLTTDSIVTPKSAPEDAPENSQHGQRRAQSTGPPSSTINLDDSPGQVLFTLDEPCGAREEEV